MDDLEERLRHDLRQRASREEPPADAWDRITERVQRGEQHSTASRVLVGALVLAITAGGLFWLWRGFVATDGGQPAGRPEDLWGRTFVSTRVTENGQPRALVDGTRIEMTFFVERDRRGLRWELGCNFFGTGVEITPDRLIVDEIETSDQGCRSDYQVQDDWLADFIGSDPSWELRDDKLSLTSGETIIELEPAPSGDLEDLWGRTFVSTRVIEGGEPRPLISGTSIELTFFEERGRRGARWSAGCNTFGTSIAITPDRLVLGEIGGTQKGGSPECQDQDDWLAGFLGSDPNWELRDDTLTLTSGETIIELEAAPSGDPEDLWGRTFVSAQVTEDDQPRALIPGTRIRLIFGKERRSLGWSAGCNGFGTRVRITADRLLLLGQVLGTLRGCSEELEEQDDWLARFFGSDPEWELRGDSLILTSGNTIIELEQSDTDSLTP